MNEASAARTENSPALNRFVHYKLLFTSGVAADPYFGLIAACHTACICDVFRIRWITAWIIHSSDPDRVNLANIPRETRIYHVFFRENPIEAAIEQPASLPAGLCIRL